MNCKACGREIPENSIYCNWCGVKQLRERRSREEVKVPTPKQLPSGSWTVYLRAEVDRPAARGQLLGRRHLDLFPAAALAQLLDAAPVAIDRVFGDLSAAGLAVHRAASLRENETTAAMPGGGLLRYVPTVSSRISAGNSAISLSENPASAKNDLRFSTALSVRSLTLPRYS